MKCKVKGLVFVGFAAAILAGAAHATGENIVTSKAYTDATYQAKTAANNANKVLKMNSNSAGDIGYTDVTSEYSASTFGGATTGGNLVTESAVAAALEAAGQGTAADYQPKVSGGANDAKAHVGNGDNEWLDVEDSAYIEFAKGNLVEGDATTKAVMRAAIKPGTIDTTGATITALTDATDTGANKLTTAWAVNQAIADATQDSNGNSLFQEKSNSLSIGNSSGEWSALDAGFANGTYTTKTANQTTGVVTIDVNATTDGTLANADSDEADFAKLPTAGAVKTYVDNKAATDLSGKQDKTGATSGYKVGNSNGTWADMGSAVTAATGGYVSVTGGANGAAVEINIDNAKIDTAVTSGSSNLVTSDAVADALAGDGTAGSGYQHTSTANYQIGNSTGTWDTMGNGTYTTWARDANTGAVTVDINATTTAAGVTTGATTIPTSGAVADAIAAQPASNIPAQNGSVCTATTPCALVAAADGYHWITMATGTHQGGVCGDRDGGTCGGMGTNPNA